MNFKKDLEFGHKYELELLKHIDHDNYLISTGIFKPYDIKFFKDDKCIRYEVKADRLTIKTNNIAIEFECSNKPSGITTTRAKYYAYFVIKPNEEYDLYIIKTKYIKECIKNKLYKRIVKGGDNYTSRMYIFDYSLFSNSYSNSSSSSSNESIQS